MIWANPTPPPPLANIREHTEYTECQGFSPVVQIGSPRPLSARECVPPSSECCYPLWFRGRTHSLPGGGAGGGANRTKGQTLWSSRYIL